MRWMWISAFAVLVLMLVGWYVQWKAQEPLRVFRAKCHFEQSTPMTDDYGLLYCVDIRNNKIDRFAE